MMPPPGDPSPSEILFASRRSLQVTPPVRGFSAQIGRAFSWLIGRT